MQYYSDKTKTLYKSEELLKEAERKYDEKFAEQEQLKKDREARAKEVSDAYSAADEAFKKAEDLLLKFCKDYGSYHTTIKGDIPSFAKHPKIFDMLFDPFIYRDMIN